MPDFNVLTPPLSITNPTALPVGAFPRHVHKLGAYLVVHSDEEQTTALAEGWSLTPIASKAHKK